MNKITRTFEESVIAQSHNIFGGENDYLDLKKDMEKHLGVALDLTMVKAVVYGASMIMRIIKIGRERDETPLSIYAVGGKSIVDLIKIEQLLKNKNNGQK